MATTIDYEDRKRPLDANDIQSSAVVSKRPHLDRSTSSFASNGSYGDVNGQKAQHDEEDGANPAYAELEAFRKEAIFRKMREAQRDLARSNAKLEQLQLQMQEADERCAAFNEFWNLLVEDVQMLVGEGKIAAEQHASLVNALAITAKEPSSSAFTRNLRERNASIKALLGLIVSLSPGTNPDVDEVQARCHRLAEEASTLRARQTRTDAERHELVEELNTTIDQLRKYEKRLDRMHSRTVKATERPGAEKEEEAEKARVEAAEAEKQAALRRKAQAEDTSMKGEEDGSASEALQQELEDVRTLAESRLKELDVWREQVAGLRKENEALRSEVQQIPQERVVQSDLYRELHRLYELAGEEHSRLASINERLEAENGELREQRQEYESKTQLDANAPVEELRAAVKTHEADVARLRGQRDDAQAELTEKRNREVLRYSQIDELKAFVQTKELRIQSLKSEVRRLHATLASKNGDEAMLNRLRAGSDQVDTDIELISDLQARLKAAEDHSVDLQRQLAACSSGTTEQQLAERVSKLHKELDELSDKLQSATSDGGELKTVDDVKALLHSQHEKLNAAKRELSTSNASTTALCDELEKLGVAYAEAQNIAASRIAELGRMEEKIARLTTEKAKADNKYFSAMRAKDAVDNEKRAVLRNVDRQARALEKYAEMEKVWQEQMQKYELEVSALRKFVKEANQKSSELQSRLSSAEESLAKAKQESSSALAQGQQRTDEYVEESKQRLSLQERNEKLQRDLDKCRKQLANASGSRKKGGLAGGNSSGGGDDQIEFLNALLRCSACADRYRDRIITRCLHTFCHECVDARIQTRQRKCPSCGLGFSTSDVQTLYFQ